MATDLLLLLVIAPAALGPGIGVGPAGIAVGRPVALSAGAGLPRALGHIGWEGGAGKAARLWSAARAWCGGDGVREHAGARWWFGLWVGGWVYMHMMDVCAGGEPN